MGVSKPLTQDEGLPHNRTRVDKPPFGNPDFVGPTTVQFSSSPVPKPCSRRHKMAVPCGRLRRTSRRAPWVRASAKRMIDILECRCQVITVTEAGRRVRAADRRQHRGADAMAGHVSQEYRRPLQSPNRASTRLSKYSALWLTKSLLLIGRVSASVSDRICRI